MEHNNCNYIQPSTENDSTTFGFKFTEAQIKLKADAAWFVPRCTRPRLKSTFQFNEEIQSARFKQLIAYTNTENVFIIIRDLID